jgi:hypothetical protein
MPAGLTFARKFVLIRSKPRRAANGHRKRLV